MKFLALALSLFSTTAFAANLNDSQIVNVVMEANSAEIEAGQMAAKKAKSEDVRKFALKMVEMHKENTELAKGVLKNEGKKSKPSKTAKLVDQQGDQSIDAYKTKSGDEFDRGYIAAQIGMHQDLLNDLTGKYIPAAKDKSVKAFLENTRDHVQEHLKEAQAIRTAMGVVPPPNP